MYQNVTGHCSKSRSSPVTDVLYCAEYPEPIAHIQLCDCTVWLLSTRSISNAADAPTIVNIHLIQPLRYISSTARLLMNSTDVETFSTADIEEYAKLLGLRLQYLNAFIRPIGILYLGSSMKCWSIVHHVTDYIYHRVIFYVTGVLIVQHWIVCVCL